MKRIITFALSLALATSLFLGCVSMADEFETIFVEEVVVAEANLGVADER